MRRDNVVFGFEHYKKKRKFQKKIKKKDKLKKIYKGKIQKKT